MRLLFRGWSRLCLHAASLHSVEASAAATRIAKAETEPTDTATGVVAHRAEAAERNAREHARRADEMEKRAVAAAEQLKALEDVAGVSMRAAEEKKVQAVRLVSADRC